MIPEALTCTAVLGLDVGKTAHWACCVTRLGEVVANAEKDLNELFSQMAAGTLVVVDQCRNIGALALARARASRREQTYLKTKIDTKVPVKVGHGSEAERRASLANCSAEVRYAAAIDSGMVGIGC